MVAAGWFATTALGAVAGATAGGIIGAIVDAGEPEQNAHVYSEAVRRGGMLVTVRTDDNRYEQVMAVMDRHGPIDPVARRADYSREGWKNFDPKAPAYRPSESEMERMRRKYQG